MGFPVNSTSTITPPCKRFAFNVMPRSKVARRISSGGVFNCRRISGSSSWSQHAYGNAIDLFCRSADQRRIADNVIDQATKSTYANQGKRVPVAHVIISGHIWDPDRGWHAFDGYHPPTHVHVDFDPQGTGTPACA